MLSWILSPSNSVNLEVFSCTTIVAADWRNVPGDNIDFFWPLSWWGDFLQSQNIWTCHTAWHAWRKSASKYLNHLHSSSESLRHLHVKSLRGKTKQWWLQDFRNTTARQRWDIFSFLPMHLPLTYFTAPHGFKTLFLKAGI